MKTDFLPEALGVLYDHGLRECLRLYPELRPYSSRLLSMRWREQLLTEAEAEVERASIALDALEQRLIELIEGRSALHGYNPPRLNPGGRQASWNWTSWLPLRMRSLLSTTTQPPCLSTTGDCSSRLAGSEVDAPIDSWRVGSGSTTAASLEPSTPSESSTEKGGQGSAC